MIEPSLSGSGAARAAAALDRAARELPDAFGDALREATRVVPEEARKNTSRLPASGGLAAAVRAKAQFTDTRVPGGRRVSARAGIDVASLNRGRLRHPLHGDRRHWYDQKVAPRWWSDAVIVARAKVEPALRAAVRRSLGS